MEESQYYGRDVLVYDSSASDKQLNPAAKKINGKIQCLRCLSIMKEAGPCSHCHNNQCHYCIECLVLGKVTECSKFIHLPEPGLLPREINYSWKGKLSSEQATISEKICKAIEENQNLLISAVTGAGKTEMIFEGIHLAISKGKRVCIAAPRIDVCLELAPRIQAIFPDEKIALLYGGSPEPYSYTKLLIATTHQLLRFREAFDLLFIDEVDSFPFHGNKLLQDRIPTVLKQKHSLIYLTATPDKAHLKEIEKGHLKLLELPARYHQHALPVPKLLWIGNWKEDLKKKGKRSKIIRVICRYAQKKKKFLVFFPNIEQMLICEKHLKNIMKDTYTFSSVSSEDLERVEKVKAMREDTFDFLLTTTILERGVTFSNIDVLVIGAENPIYSRASLVQISGRVGRKADYPDGNILFCHNGQTKEMKEAIRWIQKMNQLARHRGLIYE